MYVIYDLVDIFLLIIKIVYVLNICSLFVY